MKIRFLAADYGVLTHADAVEIAKRNEANQQWAPVIQLRAQGASMVVMQWEEVPEIRSGRLYDLRLELEVHGGFEVHAPPWIAGLWVGGTTDVRFKKSSGGVPWNAPEGPLPEGPRLGPAQLHEGLFCPGVDCGADLSMLVTRGGPGGKPKHGDVSVCGSCLRYLRYTAPAEGELRIDLMTEEEFAQLAEGQQAGLMQARGELQLAREVGSSSDPSVYEKAVLIELDKVLDELNALTVEHEKLKQRVERLESGQTGGPEDTVVPE